MINWQTGKPPDHGYYLGAWLRDGRWVVSELWFNPDSIGSGWWPTRGYLDERELSHQTIDVVAWMAMPEYSPEIMEEQKIIQDFISKTGKNHE